MNLSEIRTRVQRQFGDESGVQITNEDITRWVNDAQRAITIENENILQATQFASTVLGQQTYSLPADLLILQGISYKGPSDSAYGKLLGLDRQKFDEYIEGWDGSTYSQGDPTVYFIWDGQINLFPIPSSSSVNSLKVWYNQRPVDVVNDTDIPTVPELYHTAIVNMCLAWAYELDEDWDAVGNKGQQINADMKLLRGREDWKNQESYPVITIRAEDQGF